MYFTCLWTFNQSLFVVIFWLGYFGHKILKKSVTIHLIAKTSKQIFFTIKSNQNKMSKYDEDINENPFFIKQMSHLTSFENVVVILVPQKKSVPSKFNLEDVKG